MSNPGDPFSEHLFAGTAWYYARYRPGYPQAFFDDLIRRFNLNGTGRLLDEAFIEPVSLEVLIAGKDS